jgi:hypothetical protein
MLCSFVVAILYFGFGFKIHSQFCRAENLGSVGGWCINLLEKFIRFALRDIRVGVLEAFYSIRDIQFSHFDLILCTLVFSSQEPT